jgi:predicted Fe-Mo cluster-binding NifX family protein
LKRINICKYYTYNIFCYWHIKCKSDAYGEYAGYKVPPDPLRIFTITMKGVHDMKVAVSSNGNNLDAQLDPRFGRCAFFLVVNSDDMSFEAFNNESAAQGGGAGIQAAQFLASLGVAAVVTGNCGPNAVQTLSAAGIELFAGQAGTVREAVERFKRGNLKATREATVDSHFGMSDGSGFGRGGGMGRGMGGGRGQGRGMGLSGTGIAQRTGGGIQSQGQEMEDLKQQAGRLNEKMKEVIARINRLENSDKS